MQLISENSLNLVTALRSKGIKVVIATDNMDTFHRWTVPSLRLDSYFDHILSSFELRALKADTDEQGRSLFFTSYLKSNAIDPGESLLLDDSDEAFGQIIRQAGIDYQCLKPGNIEGALQTILASHS
jgi:FMN phosphatase YigB (HAD superfamily)